MPNTSLFRHFLLRNSISKLLLVAAFNYIFLGCSVNHIYKDPKTINVIDYGAVNHKESTRQIQKAIDYAAQIKASVHIPKNNTFLVSKLILKNGLVKIYGEGVLKGINIKNSGILIETDRSAPLTHCEISLNLDLSNGASYGILGRSISNCTISNSTIKGFTDDLDVSRFGIFLDAGSKNNTIINNKIIGFENPKSKKTSIGIYLQGLGSDFGGFFNQGEISDPNPANSNNKIIGNYVAYGKVGIDLLACEHIIVENNELYKNKTRGIYLANATNHCSIVSNKIWGFGSSAVLMGYGSHNNIFSNNICNQIYDYNHYAGEAAVNINTGAYANTIQNNTINSFTHYGVFLGVNMIDNVIKDNKIEGYYLAAIALENDFQDTPPKEARYSRPNYGPPIIGDQWASKDSYGNIIEGNIIGSSYKNREVGSIYISQLGHQYKTRDNIIKNNIMTHKQKNNISLLFFEETPGLMINNTLTGNRNAKVKPDKLYFSRGKKHFKEIRNNDGVDQYLQKNKH